MSNEQDNNTRSNFASRLLTREMTLRKKTGEIAVTTADAAKFAVESQENKEPAVTTNR